MAKKREEINVDKIIFKPLNGFVDPGSTPYTENYRDLILRNYESYEKDDKKRCHLFTKYFQYHIWNFGEIPSYDKLKEYLEIKTDKAFNKYIVAINKHWHWVETIYIKPKWKIRFKKMRLQVRG
ncbi:hypothetical protein [Clostridium kluyveri]|uniref:Uncharacterized protein n=2 Tax=Clostridium kluyveri TaxID=1534 RepID=A5N5E1_CLOK5|nr:hypothetical protein [Clostridium kluyveri]EDK32522.1 Hypothetical protein CKL_0468 [Clostridium kluyveri DSM 555]BAH05464.1 hypothetical protein CKR_0413 [Clostridium kluyveri NBRC 12016]